VSVKAPTVTTPFFPEPDLAALDLLACDISRATHDQGQWFLSWRMAAQAARVRIGGASSTFRTLTEWVPGLPMWNPEHEVAVCLFLMTSAMECWTFALNALGFGLSPAQFYDIRKESDLKQVSARLLLDRRPHRGFQETFPGVMALWRDHSSSLEVIFDNHSVSKHRHMGLTGWTSRQDPPDRFLELAGVVHPLEAWPFRAPLQRMPLHRRPKLAQVNRPRELEHFVDLIDLKREFDEVAAATPATALADVSARWVR